jgi:hypothetical protein
MPPVPSVPASSDPSSTPPAASSRTGDTPPAPARGGVALVFLVLATMLIVIPGSRSVGTALLVIVSLPALVSWFRARTLTDGSRAMTTGALVVAGVGLVLAIAFPPARPASVPPPAAQPMPVVAPVPAAGLPPAADPVPAADLVPAAVAPAVTPAPVAAPPPAPVYVPVDPAPAETVERPFVPAPAATHVAPEQAPRTPSDDSSESAGGSAYYKNCAAARAAGVAPLHTGDPGYRAGLDRDGDGIACE